MALLKEVRGENGFDNGISPFVQESIKPNHSRDRNEKFERYLADKNHESSMHSYISLTYPFSLKAEAFIQQYTLKAVHCVQS